MIWCGQSKYSLGKHTHAIQQFLKLKKLKIFYFSWKILIFSFIFAQNIDCGYTSEPAR